MYKEVSVEEAIDKGIRIVRYPMMLVVFVSIGFSFFLSIQKIFSVLVIPIGFVVAFGLAWLYWSISITRWRLWAFENVRNVNELKMRAIQEKLIWPEGGILEKTEIRSPREEKQWLQLQEKFKIKDIFTDDPSIPNETIIFYSKRKLILVIPLIGFLGAGIYVFTFLSSYVFGIGLIAVGIVVGYYSLKAKPNSTPQIVINDSGMSTVSTKFYRWKDIHNEEVVVENDGEDINFYLTYNHPSGSERLQINDYDISHKTLNRIMFVYRNRFNKMD